MMLFQSSEFLMPWAICLLISGAVLWFYRTRNPVKKFRPAWGELILLGMVLVGLSTIASFFVSKAITEGQAGIESLQKQAEGYVPTGGSVDGVSGGSEAGSVFEQSLSDSDTRRQNRPMPSPKQGE